MTGVIQFRIVCVLFLLTLLGACTGEIMQSRIDRPGADSYFRYGAAPGEMLTVVVGNPFTTVSKERLDQIVTDSMYGKHYGPLTRFTTRPGPEANRNARIVILFNPERSLHIYKMCGTASEMRSLPMTLGERLSLYAGFCVDSSLFSHAKISIPAVETPDAKEFRRMVGSAMRELVPSRDPFEDSRCRVTPCT